MNLPKEYLAWIESIDTQKEQIYRGTIICFYSKPELTNKNKLASVFFKEKVFINNTIEIKAEDLDTTNTYSFTKERADKSITIGHSNNNYIFVDPNDDFSIWTIILNNQCVFKEKGNIHDIIKLSQLYSA